MRAFRHAQIVLLVVASACSYGAPPVRVYGAPTEIERLAGQWAGEYHGDRGHRRSGSIAFTLRARTHEAAGDVLMTPEGATPYERYYGDDESRRGVDARVAPTHVLSIRFVDVDGARISGRMDNFWDPDRRTSAYAVFNGRLADDRIEGAFTTVYANGDPSSTGWWRVRRVRPSESE